MTVLPSRLVVFIVQLLSCVQLFATPSTVACQASQSFTLSQSLLKFMTVEFMMVWPFIFCHPFSFCLQSFPTSWSFPMSQLFASGSQNIRISASASVLPMNIQSWFPLGLTGLISLQSKGLSRVFSTTSWNHQFFGMYISIFKHNSAFSIFFWVLKNTRREKHYFTLLILFMGFCCYSQFHSWICSDSEFTYSDSI